MKGIHGVRGLGPYIWLGPGGFKRGKKLGWPQNWLGPGGTLVGRRWVGLTFLMDAVISRLLVWCGTGSF